MLIVVHVTQSTHNLSVKRRRKGTVIILCVCVCLSVRKNLGKLGTLTVRTSYWQTSNYTRVLEPDMGQPFTEVHCTTHACRNYILQLTVLYEFIQYTITRVLEPDMGQVQLRLVQRIITSSYST